jgi:hypothetical protein
MSEKSVAATNRFKDTLIRHLLSVQCPNGAVAAPSPPEKLVPSRMKAKALGTEGIPGCVIGDPPSA